MKIEKSMTTPFELTREQVEDLANSERITHIFMDKESHTKWMNKLMARPRIVAGSLPVMTSDEIKAANKDVTSLPTVNILSVDVDYFLFEAK